MSTGDSHQDDRPTTGDQTVPLPVTPADDGVAPPQDGATTVETTEVAGEEPPATRRTALVAAGIVALLVVVALVVWLATRGTEPTTTAPGPSPSASSPSASASGTATGSATTSPTATGSGSATSSGSASTTADPDAPVPTTIPAGLTLPAEGEEGWTSQGWSYAPCGSQVSAAGASDFRRIAFNGPEDSRNQSLLVFPTEDAAVAYLATMQAAAEACAGPGDGLADTPAVSVGTVDGDWDSSLMVVLSYPVPEGGYSPGGDYTLAARTGSAVAVSGGYAEWPPGYPTPAPAAVAAYRAALDELAPQLCAFTDDGC